MISKNDEDKVTESKPKRSLYALIMTLCGVHGTISLNRLNLAIFISKS